MMLRAVDRALVELESPAVMRQLTERGGRIEQTARVFQKSRRAWRNCCKMGRSGGRET